MIRSENNNGRDSAPLGDANLSYFLSSLPLWQLILLVVVIPTAVAMAAQLVIRSWAGVDKLAKNNEIAGFKFATVGVIYAVLLAFVVIAVWEKFSDAQNAVTDEAGGDRGPPPFYRG